MPLVSIVVPIYNVEAYLYECIESILCQSEKDIELILVDDGSTDGSGAICDQQATRDDRIHVIHQKNAGVSAARNKGIASATGDYLAFVDGDDFISPDFAKAGISLVAEYDADIVLLNYAETDAKGQEYKPRTYALPKGHAMSLDSHPLLLLNSPASACSKLFRRSLFDKQKLMFSEEIAWAEDLLFSTTALVYARRVVYQSDDTSHYFYRLRPQSATRSRKPDKLYSDLVSVMDNIKALFVGEGIFIRYQRELESLTSIHLFFYGSREIVGINHKSPYLAKLAAYMHVNFPGFTQNHNHTLYLSISERIVFRLLIWRWYGFIKFVSVIKTNLRLGRHLYKG